MTFSRLRRTIPWMLLLCWSAAAQTWTEVDRAASTVTVRVYKSGLFSAFAHNHTIRAPIAHGRVALDREAVEIEIDAAQLQVLDPEVDAGDRAQIQKRMLGPDVLGAEAFPTIAFRSRSVRKTAEGSWVATGPLTLHGQTRDVDVTVTRAGEVYRGAATVRQRDFGIQPVSIAGGAVQVKNEVRIEFEVRLAKTAARSGVPAPVPALR